MKLLCSLILLLSVSARANTCDYSTIIDNGPVNMGSIYLSGLLNEGGFTYNPNSKNVAYVTVNSHEGFLSLINPVRFVRELVNSDFDCGWFNISVANVREKIRVVNEQNETVGLLKKVFQEAGMHSSSAECRPGIRFGDNEHEKKIEVLQKNCE